MHAMQCARLPSMIRLASSLLWCRPCRCARRALRYSHIEPADIILSGTDQHTSSEIINERTPGLGLPCHASIRTKKAALPRGRVSRTLDSRRIRALGGHLHHRQRACFSRQTHPRRSRNTVHTYIAHFTPRRTRTVARFVCAPTALLRPSAELA